MFDLKPDGMFRRILEMLTTYMRFQTALAGEMWRDAGVRFTERPDGTVGASLLGVTGVGPTADAALLDLERRLCA